MNRSNKRTRIVLATLIAVTIASPLSALLFSWSSDESTLWQHLFDTVLWNCIADTLFLMLFVSVGALSLGIPLGWCAAEGKLPTWLQVLLVAPLLMPKYVMGFVWLVLIDYSGPIQSALRFIGLDASAFLQTGQLLPVGFVLSLALFPYVFLLVREGLSNLDPDVVLASRVQGAGPLQTLIHVQLPMILPWLLSGLLLVNLETLSDFGTVAIFNYDTFSTVLYKTWFGLQSYHLTAQLSSLVLVFVFLIFVFQSWAIRNKTRLQSHNSRPVRSGNSYGWSWFAGLVFFLAFVAPIGCLSMLALRVESIPRNLFEMITNTFSFGLATAVFAVALGLIFVLALRGSHGRVTAVLRALARFGYAVPGVILACCLIFFTVPLEQWFEATFGPWFKTTLAILVFGLVAKFFILAHDGIENRMSQLSQSFAESASCMGATRWQIFVDIERPLILRGVLVSGLLVFIEAAKELPITLMLRTFGMDTLAIRVFEYTSEGLYEYAAIPAMILCMLGILATGLVSRFAQVK